jgi:hypothetical protein
MFLVALSTLVGQKGVDVRSEMRRRQSIRHAPVVPVRSLSVAERNQLLVKTHQKVNQSSTIVFKPGHWSPKGGEIQLCYVPYYDNFGITLNGTDGTYGSSASVIYHPENAKRAHLVVFTFEVVKAGTVCTWDARSDDITSSYLNIGVHHLSVFEPAMSDGHAIWVSLMINKADSAEIRLREATIDEVQ